MTAPDHYIFGTIECRDAIQSSMTPEQWRGYCKGNVIKYLWRFEHKGGYADLCKAEDYLHWLMDAVCEEES